MSNVGKAFAEEVLKYLKKEITKLIANSDFVKVQVAAVAQIKQFKSSNLKASSIPFLPSKSKITGQTR